MTISGETWRTVPSVDGVLVSSEGRVIMAPSRETAANGEQRTIGGVPHFGWWDRRQARFLVSVNGRTFKVARLLCQAFHGPSPFPEAVALHLDENTANNRADNIAWGTQAENLNMPNFIHYCESGTGANNPRVKAMRRDKEEWVRELRQGDVFVATALETATQC